MNDGTRKKSSQQVNEPTCLFAAEVESTKTSHLVTTVTYKLYVIVQYNMYLSQSSMSSFLTSSNV